MIFTGSVLEITALVLISLISLRMIFSLFKPKSGYDLVYSFYNRKNLTIKRIFYLLVSIFCSYLLIRETSIVHFVIALFAIGAFFDLIFTYLPEKPLAAMIKEAKLRKLNIARLVLAIGIVTIGVLTYWTLFFKI